MRAFFLIAGLILLSTVSGRAEQFLAGFEDVPVMPGIEAAGSASVDFDSPGGRIVEAYASGSVTRAAVQSYYQSTLPQLGWTRTGPLEFSRAGERLSIELLGQSPVTVRFELAPVKN